MSSLEELNEMISLLKEEKYPSSMVNGRLYVSKNKSHMP